MIKFCPANGAAKLYHFSFTHWHASLGHQKMGKPSKRRCIFFTVQQQQNSCWLIVIFSMARKWLAPKHFLSYDPAILYCHHEESSFGPVICALCY
jgi:hypothetical protein